MNKTTFDWNAVNQYESRTGIQVSQSSKVIEIITEVIVSKVSLKAKKNFISYLLARMGG